MKKIIYLLGAFSVIAGIVFIPDWRKDEADMKIQRESVEPEKEKIVEKKAEETLEEKAYRLETTAIAAPSGSTPTEIKIWEIEEKIRIAQAKIRIRSGKDGEIFSRSWRKYRDDNKDLFIELHGYKEAKMMEARGKRIVAQFGKESLQHKAFQKLLERKYSGKISLRDFYKELNKIK